MSEESDLIRRAQGGDDDAFGRLVEMHQDRVYRTAVRLVGHEDALDIAQEVFLRAHRELKRFKGRSALSTWLYRMAVNTALNYLRGSKREHARRERFGPGTSTPPPAPDRELLDAEFKEQVWQAISSLPDRQRTAVTLHRFEGLSAVEVGEVMGLSTGAVESLLHRAKHALLKEFAARGLGPPQSGSAEDAPGSERDETSTGSNP